MTVRNSLSHQFEYFATQIGKYQRIGEVVKELGLLDSERYISMSTWGASPEIRLTPEDLGTEDLAEAVKKILPLTGGKIEKGYDDRANQITLTGESRGVRIILGDTPPSTCTVETYEEEVEVPAREAYTKTVTRYELVGDCEPILSATSPATA